MGNIGQFLGDDRGADLIEYALLAGLISLVAVGTLTEIGTSISTLYVKIQAGIEKVAP